MKRVAYLRIFAIIMAFSLIFSALGIFCAADEGGKLYVSLGSTVLYEGAAPDADSFTPVYYKNGLGIAGNESDYNAKLEFDSENGFVLTIDSLDVANAEGGYSIYCAENLTIVIAEDSKITHTVSEGTTDRYAIYVSGNLNISGEGGLDVYLLGDCDFSNLASYATRTHSITGGDKISAVDGRSEVEKQLDTIWSDFEKEMSKKDYEMGLAKLNYTLTTESLKADFASLKTLCIVALVIGSVSMFINLIAVAKFALKRLAKRNGKRVADDFDDEDDD